MNVFMVLAERLQKLLLDFYKNFFNISNMEAIKINDKVLATFQSGCLTIGGNVIMVVQQQGKEPEYCVEFSSGGHHTFPAINVRRI